MGYGINYDRKKFYSSGLRCGTFAPGHGSFRLKNVEQIQSGKQPPPFGDFKFKTWTFGCSNLAPGQFYKKLWL